MEYISTSEEICYFPLREKKKRNLESAISLIPNIKQTNSCFRCGFFVCFFFSMMNYGLLVHRQKCFGCLKSMPDEIILVLIFPLIYAHCSLA